MTDNDLLAAARMRLEGRDWDWIGSRLAYNPQVLRRELKSRLFRGRDAEYMVYPKVQEVIDARYYGSIGRFAQALGVTRQYLHQVFSGDLPMSPHLVQAIKAATGLSEEDIKYQEEMNE